MSYSPNNVAVFVAAYVGALAGLAAHNRAITSPTASSYTSLENVAGAWAEEFDTAWGANSADSLQIGVIQNGSYALWANRAPQSDPKSLTPSFYAVEANALIALIVAGEAFFSGQGITPPAAGGGGGGGITWRTVTASTNFSATSGDGLNYKNLSAPATSNLPASPLPNATYAVKISDSASATQGVTINGNGNNIESSSSPGTYAASATLSGAGVVGTEVQYTFIDGVWKVTGTGVATGASAASSALAWRTVTASTNFNATNGDSLNFKSLSAGATTNMPAAPAANDTHAIKISDAASATQGVTVSGNGNNIEDPSNPGTYAASVTVINTTNPAVTVLGVEVQWQFIDSVWKVV